MIQLEKNAAFVITDSGGVQKEAFFFKKKCLVLREQTEWVEIIENNAGVLSANNTEKIIEAYTSLNKLTPNFDNLYGDGKAAEYICYRLLN
ncbi:MAG: UDP-N-acetylglucosamine 2-epimerase [Salinivirgaceae bacterium]|nr:UDP-N-acetylglucosamine 2-epimerase [Salinivirgaceae bacterium]